MTEHHKTVLQRLAGKTFWTREDAEMQCAGVYSTGEELVRGFRVMYNSGLLQANLDGHSKIVGIWLSKAGKKIAETLKPVKVNRSANLCRVEMRVCYHADKCCNAYRCRAAGGVVV